jgi:hypothetical protein
MEPSGEKKGLTLSMVTPVLKLSKLQIRGIFTTVLRQPVPEPTAELSQNDVFYLLLSDMLERLQFLSAEQRMLLLTSLRDSRLADGDKPCCDEQLAFADGQYCTWTGQRGWTELDTGEQVTTLPHPPIETIGYNLKELYRRGVRLIENRNGFHAKKSAARSVDKQ